MQHRIIMVQTPIVPLFARTLPNPRRSEYLFSRVSPHFVLITGVKIRTALLVDRLRFLQQSSPLGVIWQAHFLFVVVHLTNKDFLDCVCLVIHLILIDVQYFRLFFG
jgi:hypothetical protein